MSCRYSPQLLYHLTSTLYVGSSMPRSYEEFYQRKREYLSEQVDDDDSNVTRDEELAILELCDAFDEDRPTTETPRWPDAPGHLTKSRSDGTLANWCYYLTTYAQEIDLLDTSVREINRVAEDWLHGESDYKNGNLSKGTIRAYQNSIRMFYRYHDDVDVKREAIAVFDREDTGIDPRDMLDMNEISAVRNAPESPRDQVVLDLLLYTGMRNGALRTLRIKDIDLETEQFYFNREAANLKNIYQPHAPRPLLGAIASIRTWLNYHPYSDEPDAYLITAKPKWNDVDPHTPVSDKTISRITNGLKDDVDIDKPMHPHAMRHNFVTLCKREYDLDDSTVKFLIGHAPDSSVMETTYSHLSGEDHISKARVAAGIEEEEEESSLTPDFCKSCGEPLGPSDVACANCGITYSPNARSTEQEIEDAMYESKGEADGEMEVFVDQMRKVANENPEVKEILRDVWE